MGSEIMNFRDNPLCLKDYLLDDLSSCSSKGFGSFPRRQCCTTVRYLLDIELKNQQHQQYSHFRKNPQELLKSPSKSALTAFLHVIAAVKRLPFPAGRSQDAEKPNNSILTRSISKKIIRKSATFWRRKPDDREIGRLKSFDELLKEDPMSSDRGESLPEIDIVNAEAEKCSGGDNRFTEVVPTGENEVVELPFFQDKKASNDVWGVSTTSSHGNGISIANSFEEKLWATEEKEQLSPVSVLECPFDDEDEEVSSPYQLRVAHVEEETKKKLMKQIQRFESLAELEPLNLTERLALLPESDNESPEWSEPSPYQSNDSKITSETEKGEGVDNKKVLGLLHCFKHKHPSNDPKRKTHDKLFSDFFREQITNARGEQGGSSFDGKLLEEVEIWINGENLYEPFLGWEVKANRQSYINDMERNGTWKTLDLETMEVASELGTEIFLTLLDEMLGVCETKATL